MKSKRIVLFIIVAMSFLISACTDSYVPKPRGYFRISFPEREYSSIATSYPFGFEKAVYSDFIELPGRGEEKWYNITTPKYKADLHITYDKLHGDLDLHIEEARKLAYDHSIKADAIDERLYTNPATEVYGMLYYIDGNAASPMQFFMTDSTDNFIRGAFYIRELPNIDSIKPVINFFEPDVVHLIETLQWNN